MFEWFLMVMVMGCTVGGIDPGIEPGSCASHEVHILMPSLEVCQQVKDLNKSGECWGRYGHELPKLEIIPQAEPEPDHIQPPNVRPMPNPHK